MHVRVGGKDSWRSHPAMDQMRDPRVKDLGVAGHQGSLGRSSRDVLIARDNR